MISNSEEKGVSSSYYRDDISVTSFEPITTSGLPFYFGSSLN